jgi:hypothetical protein
VPVDRAADFAVRVPLPIAMLVAMNSLPSTSGFARRSKGDKTRRATLACRVGPRHDLARDIGIGVATGECL